MINFPLYCNTHRINTVIYYEPVTNTNGSKSEEATEGREIIECTSSLSTFI